jgi:hypothetical protein
MQFETKYAAGIARGEQTLTFRRWKRAQAIAGNTYRTAAGRLVVDSVSIIEAAGISDAEARKAGYPDAAALREDLRGDADLPVYRVAFHPAPGEDPRDSLATEGQLSEADCAEISRRLARLDKASTRGPWTAATLEVIAANPAVRAGDLAPQLGQELLDFKLNVRKLKNLGLTISLGTGYRLSPRGEAWRERDRRKPVTETGHP